jgi:hypothetical protein
MLMTTTYLTEVEAAKFLHISPRTLCRWRWAGKGPRWAKFGGAVRYAASELIIFAASCEHEASNSVR